MESQALMDYQWCHGPSCHKRATTTRVRGVKGSKVLRTMKLKQDRVSIWKYFCDQTCMHDFIVKHIDEFARLHPRPEALETPIEVSKEIRNWYGRDYTTTQIKPIDNNSNP
tara:strand:- start:173 stop:505 length:333 start_codon:yes stop_codon:yes gene_type:complete